MGAITSRQNAGVEEVDIGVNHAYRYPPKSGNYFSSHFIMGGERFDTAQPEMYLFGENMDVNFLGSRPAPFPYPAPTANEPSKTLKALINIRKESLRFVRAPDESATLKELDDTTAASRFNIEFTFDCDVRCAITIMYFCSEEVTTSGMNYTPRDPSMNSETYHYKRGANQQFSQVCHVFDPSLYPEEELLYSFDREVLPIVIYCVAEEGEDPRQSHVTFAVVEKHSDGYALKPLKQKLFVDGLSYLLQEIYGIENKNADNCKVSTEEDTEDNGAECVICMCDLRDTLILPCRHLCLCNCCADSLRYQANNCPICRAPFRALLQIKALQKSSGTCTNPQPNSEQVTHIFINKGGDNVPPGHEAVSLIEALNGPSVAPQQPTAPPAHEMYVQLPQNATDVPAHDLYVQLPQNATDSPADSHIRNEASRCFIESITVRSGTGTVEDSTTQTERPPSSCDSNNPSTVVTEMRMSVLLAQESDDLGGSKNENAVTAPAPPIKKKASRKQSREKQQYGSKDSVKVVNELSGPRSMETVDPAETRSLLDEDRSEVDVGPGGECLQRHQNPRDVENQQKELRAPQAEAEVDDDDAEEGEHVLEKDEEEQRHQSIVVLADSTVTESDENDIPQVVSDSPAVTPRKTPRSNRSAASSDTSVPASPGGGTSNVTHQSDSVSLPGTPLSNASAISRSSDASVSSASSTRALLSHPMDGSPASVV
ncbi:probable E3 ubiquitin-protein ligase MGRN1 isoform X2 [Homarus americanus]|uniref:probable E3 ubiquitin-protein ligase MGRN1 isoform X2 n=1 Tax=Homarus americanus TaxID=6706 RepID=UPI001C47AB77|nr:probable E3 ubiquitin-protein ligase MGRN1 isoform X2 [Homarus americanus]